MLDSWDRSRANANEDATTPPAIIVIVIVDRRPPAPLSPGSLPTLFDNQEEDDEDTASPPANLVAVPPPPHLFARRRRCDLPPPSPSLDDNDDDATSPFAIDCRFIPLPSPPRILAHAAQQSRRQRHPYPFSHPPVGHPCRAVVPDDDAAPLLFLIVSSSFPVVCEGRRRQRRGRNSNLARCRHGPRPRSRSRRRWRLRRSRRHRRHLVRHMAPPTTLKKHPIAYLRSRKRRGPQRHVAAASLCTGGGEGGQQRRRRPGKGEVSSFFLLEMNSGIGEARGGWQDGGFNNSYVENACRKSGGNFSPYRGHTQAYF